MSDLEAVIGGVIDKAYAYLEETGRTESFERFPYLGVLTERLTGQESGKEKQERKTDEYAAERYEQILDRLSENRDDPVLRTAAGLALTAALVTEFAAYLNYYTGNRATLQLAFEMCGIFCPDYAEVTAKWKRLALCFRVEKKEPLNYANMEAGHELLTYLTGAGLHENIRRGTVAEESFGDQVEFFSFQTDLHPMYVREALAERGAELLAKGGGFLQICGHGGRRFLAKQIAKRVKRDMLFVRGGWLCGEENDEQSGRLMRIVHEAFLYSCIVCIEEGEQKQEQDGNAGGEGAKRLFNAARILLEAGIPVMICTAEASAMGGMDRAGITRMELTPLSRGERDRVWRGLVEKGKRDKDIERCSALYKMSENDIAQAVEEWKAGVSREENLPREERTASSRSERAESLSEICCRILCRGQKQQLGTLLLPRVGFSDLIVPERVRRLLREICCGALQGYRLYEEWGLKERYPYGRNISLLLAGPPGTGKTMTAHVLAHEIGAPLYQVDLPHIMDKYIGETEKHLEQVFAFAEKTNVILFFDEADALFAKRGEVTEGKDRYANMEVSYLLQRMEQFDGVVILATNFYQHIDKAFLRRIKYVIKYQEPGEKMRKQIWENCLVKELPREEIDISYLARQFAFSGGVIKNVVQSACISAVYEGRPLSMEHVLRAVRMEYEKLERSMTPEMWGEYGYLMEEYT